MRKFIAVPKLFFSFNIIPHFKITMNICALKNIILSILYFPALCSSFLWLLPYLLLPLAGILLSVKTHFSSLSLGEIVF